MEEGGFPFPCRALPIENEFVLISMLGEIIEAWQEFCYSCQSLIDGKETSNLFPHLSRHDQIALVPGTQPGQVGQIGVRISGRQWDGGISWFALKGGDGGLS